MYWKLTEKSRRPLRPAGAHPSPRASLLKPAFKIQKSKKHIENSRDGSLVPENIARCGSVEGEWSPRIATIRTRLLISPVERTAMGSLALIVGPMFSGKTTELQRRIRRFQIARKRYLLVYACGGGDERGGAALGSCWLSLGCVSIMAVGGCG